MNRRTFLSRLFAFFGAAYAWLFTRRALALPKVKERTAVALPPPDKEPEHVPEPDVEEIAYDDIEVLLNDLLRHTQKTGDEVASADDPRRLIMGWISLPPDDSRKKVWRVIRITRLQTSLTAWSERASEADKFKPMLVREYIKTARDRQKIAESIPGQKKRAA